MVDSILNSNYFYFIFLIFHFHLLYFRELGDRVGVTSWSHCHKTCLCVTNQPLSQSHVTIERHRRLWKDDCYDSKSLESDNRTTFILSNT